MLQILPNSPSQQPHREEAPKTSQQPPANKENGEFNLNLQFDNDEPEVLVENVLAEGLSFIINHDTSPSLEFNNTVKSKYFYLYIDKVNGPVQTAKPVYNVFMQFDANRPIRIAQGDQHHWHFTINTVAASIINFNDKDIARNFKLFMAPKQAA